MATTPQIDYDALLAKHGGTTDVPTQAGAVDYDALLAKHGGSTDSSIPDSNVYWNQLKDKYNIPRNYDLAKSYLENAQQSDLSNDEWKQVNANISGIEKARAEASPDQAPISFLGRAWDEAKRIGAGLTTESGGAAFGNPQESTQVAGFAPPTNPVPAVQQRLQEAKEHPAAAAGAATTDIAAASIPFMSEGASKIWGKISPSATIEKALGRSLSAAEADAAHPSGELIPALNNTPREVLEYAKKNGINLTPGQATGDPLAQNLEKSGKSAAIGGKDLDAAVNQNRTQFGQTVRNFVESQDPKRLGLSAEQAGETVQQTAKIAKQVAHDNAAQNYEKIGYLMDAPVEASSISGAWNKIKGDLPMGAEEGILAQTPRSMRAVVEDLLSGRPEGFKPTVQETIQLRKFFRDLGDTNGLPDKTQATYKKMESAASSALDATAVRNGATSDWQAANAGWKDYVGKYGDPKSPLYKILQQRDPTKIVTALQNAPATDIELLRNEKMDAALEPLKRQVVQDIAQNRFNIGRDGLGGYSDSYLKALFGPEKTKELYVQANLAKRLNYDPNPSGTAMGLQSLEQLKFGSQAKMGLAAKMSMPRDPLSYLPPGTTASSAGRGSLPTPISMQPNSTANIFDESLATARQPRPNLPGGPQTFEQSRLPQYIYRVHDEGVPTVDLNAHAHATGSAAEAQSYVGSRNEGTPQVVSRIKTSNFKPGDISVMQGPNGQKWYKFNRQLTSADYERVDENSTGNRRTGTQ